MDLGTSSGLTHDSEGLLVGGMPANVRPLRLISCIHSDDDETNRDMSLEGSSPRERGSEKVMK